MKGMIFLFYDATHEGMLEEFKATQPFNMDDIVDWYPSGQMEITIKFKGGMKVSYDCFSKTSKYIGRIDDEDYDICITEEQYRECLAIRLRRKMRLRGMSQGDLSQHSGISRVSLSSYMNGYSTPSAYTLVRLARVLKCSVSELADFI